MSAIIRRRRFLAGLAFVAAIPRVAAARPAQGLIIHSPSRQVPALDIRDGNGNPAGIEGLRGRAVLLNLWASWCAPCVAELPAFDRIAPRIAARGVEVVALSLDRGGAATVVGTFARLGSGDPHRPDPCRRREAGCGGPARHLADRSPRAGISTLCRCRRLERPSGHAVVGGAGVGPSADPRPGAAPTQAPLGTLKFDAAAYREGVWPQRKGRRHKAPPDSQ